MPWSVSSRLSITRNKKASGIPAHVRTVSSDFADGAETSNVLAKPVSVDGRYPQRACVVILELWRRPGAVFNRVPARELEICSVRGQ